MTPPTARTLLRLAGLGAAAAVCLAAGVGEGMLLAFLLGAVAAVAVGARWPACTCSRRPLRCPNCFLPVRSSRDLTDRVGARFSAGGDEVAHDRCDQGLHDVEVATDGGWSCACGQVRAAAEP